MSLLKLALIFMLLVTCTSVQVFASLPDHTAPDGLQSFDDPSGGRVIDGSVDGASSIGETLVTGLKRMRGYFDPSPKLMGAIRSKDGKVIIVVFSAKLSGDAVDGLAIATYDPDGHSRFGVVFNERSQFASSLKPMLASMEQIDHQALLQDKPVPGAKPEQSSGPDFAAYVQESKSVQLNSTEFPDGTATIGIADGFTPVMMSDGQFSAKSDDGSYIKIGVPVFPLDPRGTTYQMERRAGPTAVNYMGAPPYVEYLADPVQDWKNVMSYTARASRVEDPSPNVVRVVDVNVGYGLSAKNVGGTMTINNEQYAFTGQLITSPPNPTGGWMLSITMLAAPMSHADSDMPKLMAMYASQHINIGAVGSVNNANLNANLNLINSTWAGYRAVSDSSYNNFEATQESKFEDSQANQAASEDATERSTAGFIHIINGTSEMQDNENNTRGSVDSNLAGALESSDPARFQSVPLSDYIPGVDY
jgi:hypothetical protein